MHSKAAIGGWILALFVGLVGAAGAADWPQFRGPGGLGASDETGLPRHWSDDEYIVWKAELPGQGSSSPITVDTRVYLTCFSGYGQSTDDPGEMEQLERHLVCLNRDDGRILWQQTIAPDLPEQPFAGKFLPLHGYASSTPASDGEQLYVFFGRSGAFAFDLDGKQLWNAKVGSKTHNWGSATSPVLHENLVIVNASVESDMLLALDKSDGHEVWSAPGMKAAWNTPLLVRLPDGGRELVVSVKGEVLGFDPATGEKLWFCAGIDDYVCPSVIAHDGVVYVIGGRGKPSLAVRAGGRGDVTEQRLWHQGPGSNVSSPVYHDGHLYWVSESQGIAYCADAASGDLVYQERIEPRPDRIYASPVVADGKIYYVSRENGTYVVAAKPQFELLAHNVIAGDSSVFNASPAVSNGQLLLRSNRYLYCLGANN